MRTNSTRRGVIGSMAAEFAAYDSLPPSVRRALQQMKHKGSAIALRRVARTEAEMLESIEIFEATDFSA